RNIIKIGEHGDFVGNCDADTPNTWQCPYAAHSPFKILDLEGEIDEVQSRMLKCGIVNLWRERVLDRISDQRAQARVRVNSRHGPCRITIHCPMGQAGEESRGG